MRLIDANALKKVFIHTEDAKYAKWTLNGVISEIDDMPTVCDIEQIRNEVQRMADSKILNMKIVLELIDKYTKGERE